MKKFANKNSLVSRIFGKNIRCEKKIYYSLIIDELQQVFSKYSGYD
jgi:hypothetical protein